MAAVAATKTEFPSDEAPSGQEFGKTRNILMILKKF